MSASRPRPFTPLEERVGHWVARLMTATNVALWRLSGGRLGSRFRGAPVLLLRTRGRRSGRTRTVPLLYLEDGERLVIVASKGGMPHHPLWYLNLMAHPEAEVELGKERRRVRARRASPAEREALWPRLVALYPPYEQYQARTSREIPVVILEPLHPA